ncbi:MAG: very short patch repair endonuclease [Nitrososphaerota archaeon]
MTKQQRSFTMSKIHSKWTKPEIFVHSFLKGKKVKHKMHPNVAGKPDVLLIASNTVIFLHGCFWHKCPEDFKEPLTNKEYWIPKIEKNVYRDRINMETLRNQGYRVEVIWEHQIKRHPGEVKSLLLNLASL